MSMTKKLGRPALREMTTLTAQQKQACRLLSEGFSGKQVAEKLGIRQATVSKWLNSFPTFTAYLGGLQAQTWAESASMTGKAAKAGLIIAARCISDEREPMRNRLVAIGLVLQHQRMMLDYDLRSRAQARLEERLAALEERSRMALAVDASPVYDLA